VNWYPRPHLRVMLDWVESRSRDRLNNATLDRTSALLGRVQVDF
jgi:phosphate-selective porin OprO/OprP